MTNENKIKDGGPAFPTETRKFFPDKACFWHDGMSLRDWFAGMALQGMLAANANIHSIPSHAYKYADAMLKERDKQREAILNEIVKENQETVLVSPDLISIKSASGSPDFHDRANLPYPARIVIRNVYQDVNEIRGDLFFELEKNKED